MRRRTIPVKLTRPRAKDVLIRKRLFTQIEKKTAEGVVWIQGLPGAGKTALVASWIEYRRLKALWFQLDNLDSDIATFFHYFTIAVRSHISRARLPQFTNQWRSSRLEFSRRFFRQLFSYAGTPELIVLDDYHSLSPDGTVHDALRAMLQEKSHAIRIVILSRGEPPAALSRSRIHNSMHLISPAELALTETESKWIALQHNQHIEKRQIDQLLNWTDGWVAGFKLLLAGNLKNSEYRPPEYQPSKNQSPKHQSNDALLHEYFSEEVFKRIDPDSRIVLAATSLVPDFTETFALALSGIQNAGNVLKDFARKGYFIYQLHGKQTAFRYHPLFREFLLTQSEIILGDRLIDIMHTAAELLMKDGREEQALEFTCRSESWALAEEYVLEVAPTLQREGRLDVIRGTLEKFPEEMFKQNPMLQYWLGLSRFQIDAMSGLALLEPLYEIFRDLGDNNGCALVWSAVSQFYICSLTDLSRLCQWFEYLDDISRKFDSLDTNTQMVLTAAIVDALVHAQPNHSTLPEWRQKAYKLAICGPNAMERIKVGCALLMYDGFWGNDLGRARELLSALGPLVAEADPLTRVVWLIGESNYYYYLCELDKCLQTVKSGLDAADVSGYHHWDAIFLGLAVWGETQRGNMKSAGDFYQKLNMKAVHGGFVERMFGHYVAAVLELRQGKYFEARRESALALTLANETRMPLAQAAASVLHANCNGPNTIRSELDEAIQICRDINYVVGETCALLSLAAHELGAGYHDSGLKILSNAFSQARQLKLTTFMIDTQCLTRVCVSAIDNGIETEYVSSIIQKLQLPADSAASKLKAWPWELTIHSMAGQLTVCRKNSPLPQRKKAPKKILELLNELVIAGPQGQTADSLVDSLWADTDGDRAMSSLHTAIFRLRKYLGHSTFVLYANSRFYLNAQKIFVDRWGQQT